MPLDTDGVAASGSRLVSVAGDGGLVRRALCPSNSRGDELALLYALRPEVWLPASKAALLPLS